MTNTSDLLVGLPTLLRPTLKFACLLRHQPGQVEPGSEFQSTRVREMRARSEFQTKGAPSSNATAAQTGRSHCATCAGSALQRAIWHSKRAAAARRVCSTARSIMIDGGRLQFATCVTYCFGPSAAVLKLASPGRSCASCLLAGRFAIRLANLLHAQHSSQLQPNCLFGPTEAGPDCARLVRAHSNFVQLDWISSRRLRGPSD